ncbi:MAG: hypothetical protein ACLRMI_00450 [Streptococcus sp.]
MSGGVDSSVTAFYY